MGSEMCIRDRVIIDPTSALEQQNVKARTVLFTELAAGGNRGIMRTISMIDSKWIKDYLPKTKEIDIFRLAGIEFNSERKEKVV